MAHTFASSASFVLPMLFNAKPRSQRLKRAQRCTGLNRLKGT